MLETKKSSITAQESVASVEKLGDFFGGIKGELQKVTWTSREEMQLYIKVVVLSTLVFGLGVYAVDLVIQGILLGLGALVRLIGG